MEQLTETAVPFAVTLPALAEHDGSIIDPSTGMILNDQQATAALSETLATYRRATVEVQALQLRLDMRRQEAHGEVDVRLAQLPEVLADQAQLAAAKDTLGAINATLGGLFATRTGKVSIETPDALCTWGKATERTVAPHPAAWYQTGAAAAELARVLDPYIETVDGLDLAVQDVLAWLAPTVSVGELPPVRITVRAK